MNRNAAGVVVSWGAVLATAVVAFAPPPLVAQKLTDPLMPLPETSVRQRQLEPPAGADEGAGARMFEVWTVGAPPEMLLGWYLRRLNRLSPVKDGPLDTAAVQPGKYTPLSYHLTFHTFENQCADPGGATPASSDATRPCTRLKRGIDKRQTLDNNRVGYELGVWIDRVTLTWFVREATGELVRRRIELRDTGLSDDWKRYTLVTQITLEREVLEQGTH